jgi:aminopeptidase N
VPIVRFNYNDREDMFDRHSYEKGALVLHMLRNYLGDELFFEGLKKYLTEKKYQSAEMHELRLIFEEVSGEDLNWFFNQWFMSAGHPEFEIIGEVNGDSLELKISQKQNLNFNPLYKIPLDIQLDVEGGSNQKVRYWISSQDTSIMIPLNGLKLNYYVIDPNYVLLADITELKAEELWENELRAAYSYHSLNRTIGFFFADSKVETEKEKALAIVLLNSEFKNIRVKAVQLLSKSDDEEVVAILLEKLKTEQEPLVLRGIINALGKAKGESLQNVFIDKLSFPSYLVKAELVKNITDSGVIDSLFVQHKDYANYYLSKAFVDYFAENNIEGKLSWQLEAYEKQKLRRKSYFVSGVVKYIEKQDAESQSKTVGYFSDRCLNSTIESTKTSAFKALCLLNNTIDTKEKRENILISETSKKQKDKYLEVQLKYLKIK